MAAETAVYLREALARFPAPSIQEVPDEEQMVARIRNGKAALYRLPGTPVVMKKMDAGVYAERYQFSSETVAEAKNWYEVAKAYPYLQGQDYIDGLYQEYFLSPGPLIPVEPGRHAHRTPMRRSTSRVIHLGSTSTTSIRTP